MNSNFLDKFKDKTNKIPKEGVLNLIEATHKKHPKLVLPKPKDTIQPPSQINTKPNHNKSKKNSSSKPNKPHSHASYSANQPKRNLQKSLTKNREILSVKQNKKPIDVNINVKNQPLKLPKITKPIQAHHVQSVRQTPKQTSKSHLKQNHEKIVIPQKINQKLKRSIVSDVRQSKPLWPQGESYGLESMLDDEALMQFKKLNDFELIVHEISLKRQQQTEHEGLYNSRYNRKGLTVHY